MLKCLQYTSPARLQSIRGAELTRTTSEFLALIKNYLQTDKARKGVEENTMSGLQLP